MVLVILHILSFVIYDLALVIFVLSAVFFLQLLWYYLNYGNVEIPNQTGIRGNFSQLNKGNKGKKSIFDEIPDNTYREFSEMLPEIVYQCDQNGKLLFTNKAGLNILGITEDDIKAGLNVFDFIHKDDLKDAEFLLKTNYSYDEPIDNEYRIVTRKGEVRNILAFTMPVFNQNNEYTGIRGLAVDISQRKKNEDALHILQDIVSNMNLGLNVFKADEPDNPSAFRLEIVNEAAGKLMRFFTQANIGKTIDELSPVFRKNRLHNIFFNVVKTQTPSEIEEFVYQPEIKDNPLMFNLKIYPLPAHRVAMFIEDVTPKKNTEATLKMTRFGIENAGDLILWIDENATITFANQTAAFQYGYSREDLLKMSLPEIDTRITAMQWYELVQILETKHSITMESIHKTKSGKTFPVEISINKVIYEGKKQYFAFVRDITERNLNLELEQKIQVARKSAALKQQFLANMSHEIRTPMTGIMGMTSLLMRSNLSLPQQEYVRNIKISSENLLNIINDVLDLSKIEAGKMELKPTRIVLAEFMNQIREMFQHQAERKELKLSTSIDAQVPGVIFADENRLKQLINNLMSNAFKFTDEGKVSIGFKLKEKYDDYILLSCEVKDTGMGISEQNQKQIFEKFTQIDSSLIRPFEGTGLGLAICRELTTLMGGDINVESELGKGSTFTFTFRAGYDKSDNEKPVDISPADLKDLNLNVLHVEDKLLNQKVVGFILINAGCNVDFLTNGKDAVEKYEPGKYDIILMDIQMPVMDGISAYKELKKLHGSKLCPVIGLSANALEGDAEKFMEMGLDDYIAKPFKPQQLYEKVLQWSGKISGQKDN